MAIASTNGTIYAAGNPYYDNILTNYFVQNLPDALNKSTVLLDHIQKVPKMAVSGRYLIWPVNYGRNSGHSNVGYGSAIPDPGQRPSKTAGTLTRKQMARIALDGDTIRHGKTNGGAYFSAVGNEMESILTSMSLDRARQVHNDSSGRICEISSVATTTITAKVNSSIEGASTTRAAGTLENYLDEGMRIMAVTAAGAIHANAGGQNAYYVRNVAVSGSAVTFQVSATPTSAVLDVSLGGGAAWIAGDWIVTAATDAATTNDSGLKHEMMGIGGIFSDIGTVDGVGVSGSQQSMVGYDITSTSSANFQGVVCSTNLWNQGIVIDNGGAGVRPISEALLQQTISDAERINNANVTLMLSHQAAYDAYVELTVKDKRYVNTTELKGGHTTLSFNGMPWVKDRHCYQNRVYFLGLDQMEIAVTQELQALQVEDIHVWERLPDLDKYWRGWVREDNLLVKGVRNRCGAVLTELSA